MAKGSLRAVIGYQDGEIMVLDRAAIENRSCECYNVVNEESDRLLPLSARNVH